MPSCHPPKAVTGVDRHSTSSNNAPQTDSPTRCAPAATGRVTQSRITLRGADGVEDLKLFAATDASWTACRNSGRSTSGGALGLGTSFFMFVSHLQSSVATSSAEAEVYGISDRVNDIIYYRAILQAAMKMIQRPMATNKSKHIGTRLLRIKELVNDRVVSLEWVSTDDQPSDCLTKSLTLLNSIIKSVARRHAAAIKKHHA